MLKLSSSCLFIVGIFLAVQSPIFSQEEPAFAFISPSAADTLLIGSFWNIQWTTTLDADPVTITYFKDGLETPWHYSSWNCGSIWVEINSYASPPGTGYQFKISKNSDPSKSAFSDTFTIKGGPENLYLSYGSKFKLYKEGTASKPKVYLIDPEDPKKRKKPVKVDGFDNLSISCALFSKVPAKQYSIWIEEKKGEAELWSEFTYVSLPIFDSITYDGAGKITIEGNYFGSKKPTVYMLYIDLPSSKIKKVSFKVLEYGMEKIVVWVKPETMAALKAKGIDQSNLYVCSPIGKSWGYFDF